MQLRPHDPLAPPESSSANPNRDEPAITPAGAPRTDLIPRAVLFGNRARTHAQISPDGKWLSWHAPHDGVLSICIAPAGDLDHATPITPTKQRPFSQATWTFDGKHLV